MKRRDFVRLGSLIAATATQLDVYGGEAPQQSTALTGKTVDFVNDGVPLSPKEYGELLMKLADEGKIKTDFYSNGGVVEELENRFAKLMGKESSVFMPTGTLANHMALRRLAANNRRVILQEQSHIYQDTGDGCQTLSALNLIPLGLNTTEMTLEEIKEVVDKTAKGRVALKVGAICIESPVRRQQDTLVPFENMKAITDYARANDIKTHLDGARLFVQAAHTGITPAAYGALFDTSFTSICKCFNAASGAVLAGSKEFTHDLFHERRMFGAGIPAVWPFAAVALHYVDTWIDEYKSAWQKAEYLFTEIQKDERCKIVKYKNGSHIVHLDLKNIDKKRFSDALAKRNIRLSAPDVTGFNLKVNISMNRMSAQEIAGKFKEAMKEVG